MAPILFLEYQIVLLILFVVLINGDNSTGKGLSESKVIYSDTLKHMGAVMDK